MKKITIFGLFVTLILTFSGCEKAKDPAGVRNVAVIPEISNVKPGIFDSKNLATTFVEFEVNPPSGTTADKIAIQCSYNGDLKRVELSNVTTFPATVRITAADAAAKLGIALESIANGDVFTLEMVTTAKGVTTRSNTILNVNVACAFNKTLTTGSYHSVSAAWATEGDITITADPDDEYTVYVSGLETLEGFNEDKALVMHIDPVTFAVTADNTVIVSSTAPLPYGSVSYGGKGQYASCDGSYSMIFEIILSLYGNQGKFQFDLTRN